MAETDKTSTTSSELKPYVEYDRTEVLRVAIVGLIAGLLVPLLGLGIANGLIAPIFCQPNNNSFEVCASGGIVAYHTAAIIVALGVTALFANWGIFRPLPLVLAVTISMWGFKKYVDSLATQALFEYIVLSVFLTALCYVLFYWLLRLRNFPLSIILTIIATALVCWALVA